MPIKKQVQSAKKTPSKLRLHTPTGKEVAKLYTLEVFLIGGQITEKFAKKNPVVSRTIKIRGDQTLKELHHAIFDAFERWDEHMYEFQFGKKPMDWNVSSKHADTELHQYPDLGSYLLAGLRLDLTFIFLQRSRALLLFLAPDPIPGELSLEEYS